MHIPREVEAHQGWAHKGWVMWSIPPGWCRCRTVTPLCIPILP